MQSAIASIDWYLILVTLAKTAGVLGVVLTLVSYTVYAERRVSALIQDRLGPNRVGPAGLLQPLADAVKLLIKEDFTPAHVNKFYYWIAPGLGIAAVLAALAVVPFGSTLFGERMVIADVNVGPLYIFALTSLAVYGIVLGGWSANSKYPFLGGIRSTSQMISYELALGLSVVPLFLILSKLNLVDIVWQQAREGWLLLPFTDIDRAIRGEIAWSQVLTLKELLLWIPIAISFVIFTVSLFAETNRLPFDLPECETELVGGYHTEYSSMKFALFFLGEYAAMIAGSALIVTLFLGGWHLPFIPDGSRGWVWGLVNIAVFFGKVIALLLFFIWVRWTLPRFRYDQLMTLGWIWFFEIALVNVFLVAGILAFMPN